ncbi:MAG: histidinol dehydrogenase [Oscillospiraceae bacterium]|jgi:histidinol dehydrogenase|nr:histidinol dehydrogenase [Oscillospiraceae bacterium]
MMRVIRCENPADAKTLLMRKNEQAPAVDAAVREILEAVKARGDQAVLEYTQKLDGVLLKSLEIAKGEMAAAAGRIGPEFLGVLKEAAENIGLYHEKQRRAGYMLDPRPGVIMGRRVLPLERVGIYVPGGTARYPSTVLMNAIPARLAGVDEIVMVTPPGANGAIPDDILAAAFVAGVSRVFAAGGAQGVAALAYGTQSVPKVDKIVGPGNIFVATAKRMVFGLVDIDIIAGPSEILIVADKNSNPAFVAADLLSQAEHDPLSAAILATDDEGLAQKVCEELESQLKKLARREIAEKSIRDNGAIFIVRSAQEGVALSNELAPEHLELCVDEPFGLLPLVKHAGSVFLGRYTPEALGDYLAGPNHTLPTGGTARFSSPLSVDDFVKTSSFLCYTKEAMGQAADSVALFARREGLTAHANSALIRKEQRP